MPAIASPATTSPSTGLPSQTVAAASTPGGIGPLHIEEWQAILAAYGVLLIMASTKLAPLASLMAWGIAITYLIDTNATQGHLISNLFAGPAVGPAASPGAPPISAPSAGPTVLPFNPNLGEGR